MWKWLVVGLCACSPKVQPLDNIVAVSVGADHACALDANHDVWCWGENVGPGSEGKFGTIDGSKTQFYAAATRTGLTGVQELADARCARVEGGAVSCWGPELGPPKQLEALRGSGALYADREHACTTDGSHVTCVTLGARQSNVTIDWPDASAVLSFDRETACVRVHGVPACRWLDRRSDHELPHAGLQHEPVIAVAMEGIFTCAANRAGAVTCWVNADPNRPEQPLPIANVTGATAIAIYQGDGCARITDGMLACWRMEMRTDGTYTAGPATVVEGVSGVTSFGVGNGYACAVEDDHHVKCWGRIAVNGRLGNGTGGGGAPGGPPFRATLVMKKP